MSADALGSVETTSLADQAYRRLRDAIRGGVLRPGEKITERDLAARLGVSPTPVREALRQLVHEKVVERAGPRALRIADHSSAARSEIVEAEVRLSALMARLAARNATAEQLTGLVSLLAQTDQIVAGIEKAVAGQGVEADVTEGLAAVFHELRLFHRQVEASAGNPVLEGLLDQARAFSDEERLDLTMRLARERAEAFRARYHEHRELLDALLERDEGRAEELAARHHRAALGQLSGG
ncbi:GntR family transcriptional regulator [Streptomyces iranensis]|uniref:DNA-binding GntR family transcriptional regulator n=1 Tax=Streptomyces iranensis TaxID=576784 RepID=A0A060ZD20_9ACTN|nr:GntR family transcriptional regulator [Streptomyces iranensis]MBP2066370.1 DNA-binding GntR family transcriptional regulator [Streptomyces iranensis]CDR02815.1 transcriptional regulator, GntR family [Streptomyces iranensis]